MRPIFFIERMMFLANRTTPDLALTIMQGYPNRHRSDDSCFSRDRCSVASERIDLRR